MYDSYPDVTKPKFLDKMPSVSVTVARIRGNPFEMGNPELEKRRACSIDVFTVATLDGQLSDLVDILLADYETAVMDVMNYNLATPVSIKQVQFEELDSNLVVVVPRIYNQATITFNIVSQP